jgi:endogenous inhibitor of DNA gyrase (YacG/DUF329 family)
MPIATVGQPVELECPWCHVKASAAVAATLASRVRLADKGGEGMKTGTCPACGKNVGIVLKSLYYRVVQVP